MTARGKTLTVTYGAFACTIDGYDDPMPVLRAVTAHFCDLTTSDAQFGAIASPVETGGPPVVAQRASPLPADEIASLAAPEPGESRVTAAVSTQAARARRFDPRPEAKEPAGAPEPFSRTAEIEPMPEQTVEERTVERTAGDDMQTPAAPVPEHAGNSAAEGDDADIYRADLALLERAGILRPAPLELTAEHRVDRRPGAMDLMPHEVMQEVSLNATRAARVRVAEFVRSVGATTLVARMEAAAAHAIVMEGRDTLSRPALLRAMDGLGADAPGFEDGLKAFGLLLRDGRLIKADYGRYTLIESSPYLEQARQLLDRP